MAPIPFSPIIMPTAPTNTISSTERRGTSRVQGSRPDLLIPLKDIQLENFAHVRIALSDEYAVIGQLGTIDVYSLPEFRLIHSLECGTRINSLIVHNSILVSMEEDCGIRIWDLHKGERLHTLMEGTELLTLAAGPECEDVGPFEEESWPLIAFYYRYTPSVRIWSLRGLGRPNSLDDHDGSAFAKKPQLLREISGHRVTCIALRRNTAVLGCDEYTVRAWDISTGSCTWVFLGHTNAVTSVELDATRLYTGSADRTVRIWDILTGECLHILKGHLSFIAQLALSTSFLISSGFDRTICIWDSYSKKQVYQLKDCGSRFRVVSGDKITLERKDCLELLDVRHQNRILKKLHLQDDAQVLQFECSVQFCVAWAINEGGNWAYIWKLPSGEGDAESEVLQPEQNRCL
ncbi:hypothetical protein CVT26_013244 [Gymnopilus dilepis]|uniref:Uncharacterized protein n=1 Tax=Gymnopilus dilepis TaxID=231916 RepID=A0A409VUJ5_9AGAR|nr:hypothetical protein CVT26_013244 [Gymnopilus dilepis]